jgi:predicted phage baseplate assembly protein
MEFKFLTKLPNSNLDDRAFKDLVEECILRIPRYTPEWTNHNPGDPGITLVELFAWLTDQMGLRFNQVPRRNYVAFLELLGIRLAPPTPARTDITFYLSGAQSFSIEIPRDTEVATERTAGIEAVVFSTDRPLIISTPLIKHFLTARTSDESSEFNNNFRQSRYEDNREWGDLPRTDLFPGLSLKSCLYLILEVNPDEEAQSLAGNVIELSIRGEAATGTGIKPEDPPRKWEAWNGEKWQNVLRQEVDDGTTGFNFARENNAAGSSIRQASIMLHLPVEFPVHRIGTDDDPYEGHIIRCVYDQQRPDQAKYDISPSITGLGVRSIGGTVPASQGIRVKEELLGISDGKPGQMFQLQMRPVLKRENEEHIQIIMPTREIQNWSETDHFGASGANHHHYVIDSETGTVQFGPVIRGPLSLKYQTNQRSRLQAPIQQRPVLAPLPEMTDREADYHERQYGAVPPAGSEIMMISYRYGGSKEGNVQAGKIVVARSSLPYVNRVVNYQAATGGSDGESIEEAVIRVPQLIRSREAAITPEDFETVVMQVPSRSVARAYCMREAEYTSPGVVRLLIVPDAKPLNWSKGMNPDELFYISDSLKQEIKLHFRDRKPLGIKVQPEAPEYVGISVQMQVYAESTADQALLQEKLKLALYQFLNPLTGGVEKTGWVLGRPVYVSDIVSLCQKIPGVRHVGLIQFVEARRQEGRWVMLPVSDENVNPGPLGYICSWEEEPNANRFFAPFSSSETSPGHTITFAD